MECISPQEELSVFSATEWTFDHVVLYLKGLNSGTAPKILFSEESTAHARTR